MATSRCPVAWLSARDSADRLPLRSAPRRARSDASPGMAPKVNSKSKLNVSLIGAGCG